MKHILCNIFVFLFLLYSSTLMLCIFGCGHNMVHVDKGLGFVSRIPLPDGNALIDVKIGKIDSTTLVLRGGANYDGGASTGGSIFGPAGTSDRMQLSTIPQLNEGYLADVLNNPYTKPEVKIAIVNYLVKQSAPTTSNYVTKSIGAAQAVGDVTVEPVTTGVDKVIEKTAEVVPKITPPIANTVSDVSKNVSIATADSVKEISQSSKAWIENIKGIVGYILIGFILLVFLIVYIIHKFKKKNNINTQLETETKIEENK